LLDAHCSEGSDLVVRSHGDNTWRPALGGEIYLFDHQSHSAAQPITRGNEAFNSHQRGSKPEAEPETMKKRNGERDPTAVVGTGTERKRRNWTSLFIIKDWGTEPKCAQHSLVRISVEGLRLTLDRKPCLEVCAFIATGGPSGKGGCELEISPAVGSSASCPPLGNELPRQLLSNQV
jgi:hypothetical protein